MNICIGLAGFLQDHLPAGSSVNNLLGITEGGREMVIVPMMNLSIGGLYCSMMMVETGSPSFSGLNRATISTAVVCVIRIASEMDYEFGQA